MKSRLDALLRQRELLREHAAWLDAEIAREKSGQHITAPAATTALEPEAAAVVNEESADAVLPEPDVKGLHAEVRQGCLLYAAIFGTILVALVGFIYWRY